MGNLVSFFQALERLGKNNPERAQELGITPRVLSDYRAGRLPRFGRLLLRHPDLLAALLDDARAGRTNGNHDAETA